MKSSPDFKQTFAIYFLLIGLTLGVFGRAIFFPYVVLDDHYYLSNNAMLTSGLSGESLYWAFTTFQTQDWQPLTWLSWMIPAHFFGLSPKVSHAINIALHLANVLLLFAVLRKYTGSFWRAALVSALFAIHPMRVESVVWAAERKDVLSGFFWMLSLLSYFSYVKKPSRLKMARLGLFFLLGLMSKPVVVTLPAALLLLDYWPLKRHEQRKWGSLILEKAPLFFLSIFSAVMTLLAVQSSMVSLDKIPFHLRAVNVFISLTHYLIKTFWPHPLAYFYPHPMENYSQLMAVCGALLLAGISFGVFIYRRKAPYAMMGWFWFLAVLFPMINLIQIGKAGMADRYTYLPHIGLGIALVWALSEIPGRWKSFISAGVLLGFAIIAFGYAGYWKDAEILDRYTLKVTGQNPIVENNLQFGVVEKGMANKDVDGLMEFFAKSYGVEPSEKENANP